MWRELLYQTNSAIRKNPVCYKNRERLFIITQLAVKIAILTAEVGKKRRRGQVNSNKDGFILAARETLCAPLLACPWNALSYKWSGRYHCLGKPQRVLQPSTTCVYSYFCVTSVCGFIGVGGAQLWECV